MPLPPITKSEIIKHKAFIKEQFERGAYANKSPDDIIFLQAMLNEDISDSIPDERDLAMEERRCPIWGHCCPDSKEQASECRVQMEEDE